jgi:hypothetical protein
VPSLPGINLPLATTTIQVKSRPGISSHSEQLILLMVGSAILLEAMLGLKHYCACSVDYCNNNLRMYVLVGFCRVFLIFAEYEDWLSPYCTMYLELALSFC